MGGSATIRATPSDFSSIVISLKVNKLFLFILYFIIINVTLMNKSEMVINLSHLPSSVAFLTHY